MPVVPVTKEIAGRRYQLTPLTSRKCLEVFGQLTEALGPAVVTLLEKVDGKLSDLPPETLANAARDVCSRPLARELLHYWDVFVEQTVATSPDGAMQVPLSKVCEAYFTGQVQDMLALLKAHLELNFSSFFAALPSYIATVSGK